MNHYDALTLAVNHLNDSNEPGTKEAADVLDDMAASILESALKDTPEYQLSPSSPTVAELAAMAPMLTGGEPKERGGVAEELQRLGKLWFQRKDHLRRSIAATEGKGIMGSALQAHMARVVELEAMEQAEADK